MGSQTKPQVKQRYSFSYFHGSVLLQNVRLRDSESEGVPSLPGLSLWHRPPREPQCFGIPDSSRQQSHLDQLLRRICKPFRIPTCLSVKTAPSTDTLSILAPWAVRRAFASWAATCSTPDFNGSLTGGRWPRFKGCKQGCGPVPDGLKVCWLSSKVTRLVFNMGSVLGGENAV